MTTLLRPGRKATPPSGAADPAIRHAPAGSARAAGPPDEEFGDAWRRVEAALGRVEGVSPGPAARARDALRQALAPIAASAWPEVAGRFSRLTTSGHPVELAWTSRDAGVRWTAEVAPPETPTAQRLGLAATAAGLPAALARSLVALQAGAPLGYGAWWSMRHDEDGTDRAKAYAELPPGAPVRDLVDHPVLRSAGIRWRMAGANDDGSLELYGRLDRPDEADLLAFEEATLGSSGRLWRRVRALTGADELARPSGLSVVFGRSGRPVAVTWFAQAYALFAGDDATAAALTGRTARPPVAALLRALAGPQGPARRVGPVGVGVAADGSSWVQAGVLPG